MSVVRTWDELDRIAALHETAVLDTAPESSFDTVVALAAQLFAAPMAAISLIDEERQWLKSRLGLRVGETPRSEALCDVAVGSNRPLVVPDARQDPRFWGVPAVVDGVFVSYVGVPVSTRDGLPLGTLCVLDVEPREFDPARVEVLRSLAELVGHQLELRRLDAAAGLDPNRTGEMVSSVRRAIEEDELTVHYQPILDLATLRVTSVEALVRWEHPTLGLLPPAEFLAVAEVAGLGAVVDRFVLRRAATALRLWRSAVPQARDLRLAVNVGLRANTGPAWARQQLAVLAEVDLSPRHVTFEVSERSISALPTSALEALDILRQAGAGIAIDDIGTGTSSWSRLLDVPATSIKIDRSFVAGLGVDPRRDAVVAATCRVGDELGLEVVAEGVEDASIAPRLRAMGATSAQGYAFSPPVRAQELCDWLGGQVLPGRVPGVGDRG